MFAKVKEAIVKEVSSGKFVAMSTDETSTSDNGNQFQSMHML